MKTEDVREDAQLQTVAAKPKPKLGMIILLVLAGIVVAGLAAATYLFLLKPGPDQVVRKYLAAQATGDYATLKALLTQASADQLFPPGQPLPEPDKSAPVPDMEIGKASINGNRASVPVKLKQGEATFGMPEQSIDMILAKEGGEWKVDLKATVEELTKKLFGGQGMDGGQMAPPEGAPPAEAPAPAPPSAQP